MLFQLHRFYNVNGVENVIMNGEFIKIWTKEVLPYVSSSSAPEVTRINNTFPPHGCICLVVTLTVFQVFFRQSDGEGAVLHLLFLQLFRRPTKLVTSHLHIV
jgi:hypothetical protein